MSEFKDGEKLVLRATRDIDPGTVRFKAAITSLENLGFVFENADDESVLPVISMTQFASSSPIDSEDSYLGFEHFAAHHETWGISRYAATLTFRKLVRPLRPVPSERFGNYFKSQQVLEDNQRVSRYYDQHGVVVTSRQEADLPEVPKDLQPKNHHPANNLAIQAGSVLSLASEPEQFCDVVFRAGKTVERSLGKIAFGLQNQIA